MYCLKPGHHVIELKNIYATRLLESIAVTADASTITEVEGTIVMSDIPESVGNNKDLLVRIEQAPWKSPESVVLLVLGEQEMRPAVWGFAGARYFGSVDEPRKFVGLVECVPS